MFLDIPNIIKNYDRASDLKKEAISFDGNRQADPEAKAPSLRSSGKRQAPAGGKPQAASLEKQASSPEEQASSLKP